MHATVVEDADRAKPRSLARWMRDPFVHFLAIGLAILALYALVAPPLPRPPGTRSLTLAQRKKDVLLVVTGRKVDLAAAAREDHPITVTIEGGLFRSVRARTWTFDGKHLSPEDS